jgi:hypothetical protein
MLLILSIRQLKKLLKEPKWETKSIASLSLTAILFILTFYNFNKIPHSIIEKVDWTISYNTRNTTVDEVLNGTLKPNTQMTSGICKLPFDFPIISNGGNDILIIGNENDNTKTIKFWISRGFFDSPQKYFIYTNDNETKKQYRELIKSAPDCNWEVAENWYRIMERD